MLYKNLRYSTSVLSYDSILINWKEASEIKCRRIRKAWSLIWCCSWDGALVHVKPWYYVLLFLSSFPISEDSKVLSFSDWNCPMLLWTHKHFYILFETNDIYVCVCKSCQCIAEEAVGVTGSCESINIGVDNSTQVLWKIRESYWMLNYLCKSPLHLLSLLLCTS